MSVIIGLPSEALHTRNATLIGAAFAAALGSTTSASTTTSSAALWVEPVTFSVCPCICSAEFGDHDRIIGEYIGERVDIGLRSSVRILAERKHPNALDADHGEYEVSQLRVVLIGG